MPNFIIVPTKILVNLFFIFVLCVHFRFSFCLLDESEKQFVFFPFPFFRRQKIVAARKRPKWTEEQQQSDAIRCGGSVSCTPDIAPRHPPSHRADSLACHPPTHAEQHEQVLSPATGYILRDENWRSHFGLERHTSTNRTTCSSSRDSAKTKPVCLQKDEIPAISPP